MADRMADKMADKSAGKLSRRVAAGEEHVPDLRNPRAQLYAVKSQGRVAQIARIQQTAA